jgi:ligand-binding sensor domain-containing protein
MDIRKIFPLFFFVLCGSCTNDSSSPFHPARAAWVYCVKQHNDSIYFSTLESGIFRFHPDRPEDVRLVGRNHRLPFRSLCFTKDNKLLASSYYSGVFCASKDSLLPLPWARYPAWAMKLDDQDRIWLACAQGVMRQRGDTMVRFCGTREAHDLAFFDTRVAVAHMRGISLYNKETGAFVREYAPGLVCWTVTAYDSLCIGGGVERCLVISRNNEACREIRFGPKGNILWATALAGDGTLYLATQRGLLCARGTDSLAHASAYENECIKSVLIDNKGRVWVGRFTKQIGRLF